MTSTCIGCLSMTPWPQIIQTLILKHISVGHFVDLLIVSVWLELCHVDSPTGFVFFTLSVVAKVYHGGPYRTFFFFKLKTIDLIFDSLKRRGVLIEKDFITKANHTDAAYPMSHRILSRFFSSCMCIYQYLLDL